MDNDQVILFLMTMSGTVARLHWESRQAASGSNRGKGAAKDWTEAFDEGYARWMGWRGEAEQEREIRNVREGFKKGT